ncbi:MAG: hypothetical protein UV61_C0009G0009 [Candidatus Gottesmanbacteria bacterium GW2011_GWB1_43_11]|uniref:Uncharacterized protein n=1 Tax=Candidatus Gottesmanbacteria bacterium GW2011_GWB1_43_11 TaxID=1618446 RepID=A0A0G1CLV0_9BACT|nr:MAG: hypothetical protein UV17_C0024G0006 [Candidatus Gottesmanbacteria bacterium GW2011_GWA1_42_26]KKS81363.1 MAG: hypothetical protein UV55_C0015G0009 [Candidatus Gottesmanbacteria bacterium GW2011_GWC1_43_10]KKS86482.1 MAG: hypothetical protein UV61_C0009G0009 [Candidatus Gottesmanbacteria bacterium GW2011_GWB1_43_11]OGG10445.1 MAG: hypothetical protein A2699_04380 [Candidatus Gottesmanbacteria bacterium RIFCSPHIGHO2_01_FULL_43_15]OGG28158.1 MAG: hypothetical protein A3A59_03975 [Candidat
MPEKLMRLSRYNPFAREILAVRRARLERRGSPWGEPFIPRSKLYVVDSGSFLESSLRIAQVRKELLQAGIFPDALFPKEYMHGLPGIADIMWTEETDSSFALVDEIGDTAYQIAKLAIADRATTEALIKARERQDSGEQMDIIARRFQSTELDWLVDLVGKQKISLLARSLISAMDSRSERGASPVVQDIPHIWRKLFTGAERGERMGEYRELLLAAWAVMEDGTGKYLGDADFVNGVLYLKQCCDEVVLPYIENTKAGKLEIIYTEEDEPGFYFGLRKVIDALCGIVPHKSLRRYSIIKLALQKQLLRQEVGANIRNLHNPNIDARAATKVLVQLYLPYLYNPVFAKKTKIETS